MKIGIITIQKSEINYGASLQCFALWKYIKSMGHDCEVIDLLRPIHRGYVYKPTLSDLKNFLSFRILQQLKKLKCTIADEKSKKREQLFRDFNNQISYSPTYKNPDKLKKNPPDYDVYISGSDQIWNPFMPFENDSYLLSFVLGKKKRMAYASSFAVKEIPIKEKETYKLLLSKYDYLSTREIGGREIIQKLLNKTIPVVLDPVFLLSVEEWTRLSDKSYFTNKNYVLIYSLRLNAKLCSYAIQAGNRLNCKVVLINADYQTCKEGEDIVQLRDAGPAQWLAMVRNAKLFLTDSFHGTAFALLFGTPFLTFVKNHIQLNDRIQTLLSKTDLLDHIIDEQVALTASQLTKKAEFDMEKCAELLHFEIEKAQDYLIHSIESQP